MTDTPTPPVEAVEIVRRSQCWFSQVDGECCQVNRRCYTDATAALTALAAAGWTLTPPGKLAKARAAYKARAGTYQLTDDGWTRVPASKP